MLFSMRQLVRHRYVLFLSILVYTTCLRRNVQFRFVLGK